MSLGVVLRALAPEDLEDFQAYRQDVLVGQYQGWTATSDEEAMRFLTQMANAERFQPGIWFQLGIAEEQHSTLIGDIGICLAADGESAEIGFSLGRPFQGRGLGSMAVRKAIDLIFEETNARRVIGITDARNDASIRLLERVRMRRISTAPALFRGETCIEHTYELARAAD